MKLVFRKVDLNNSKKVPKGLYKKNNRGWLVMSEDDAIIWDENNNLNKLLNKVKK